MLTLIPNPWKVDEHHGFSKSFQWKVTPEGIITKSFTPSAETSPVLRTRGKPLTITRIRERYGEFIDAASQEFAVPPQIIAAVIATESHGRYSAERYEVAIDKWSVGLMQLLTSTAAGVARALKLTAYDSPDVDWRRVLYDPKTNIKLGTAFLAMGNQKQHLQDDPILMYAAYNSGTARVSSATKWGMVYYGNAMDNFAAWYGDACEVYR